MRFPLATLHSFTHFKFIQKFSGISRMQPKERRGWRGTAISSVFRCFVFDFAPTKCTISVRKVVPTFCKTQIIFFFALSFATARHYGRWLWLQWQLTRSFLRWWRCCECCNGTSFRVELRLMRVNIFFNQRCKFQLQFIWHWLIHPKHRRRIKFKCECNETETTSTVSNRYGNNVAPYNHHYCHYSNTCVVHLAQNCLFLIWKREKKRQTRRHCSHQARWWSSPMQFTHEKAFNAFQRLRKIQRLKEVKWLDDMLKSFCFWLLLILENGNGTSMEILFPSDQN